MHMPSQERLGVGHGWISHLGTRASHGRAGAKLYGHDMARCRKKMTHRNSKRRVGQASSRGEQDRERREGEDSVRVEGSGRSNLNPSRSEVGGRARGLGGPRRGGVAWGRVRTTPSTHGTQRRRGAVGLPIAAGQSENWSRGRYYSGARTPIFTSSHNNSSGRHGSRAGAEGVAGAVVAGDA